MHHSIIHTIQRKILEIATIIKLLNNTSEKKGCLNTMYFYHRSNHRPASHHTFDITHQGRKKLLVVFFFHPVKSPSQITRSKSNHPVEIDRCHYTSGTEKASRCFLLMFSSSSKLPEPTPVPVPVPDPAI